MVRVWRLIPALVALSIIATACGSNATESTGSTLGSIPSDGKTPGTDPAPPLQQTTLADVDRLDPNDPGDFPRALVPVDAFAADEVLIEATPDEIEATSLSLETPGHLVVPVDIEVCTLIAVWALPHPHELAVGYEDHPNIDCVRSVPRTAFFVIPMTGENSQGMWDYATPPTIKLLRQMG